MRYLGLALFAEGPTDHRFLRPLLRRLSEELCARHGESPIEIGDVLELHTLPETRDESREVRILAAARDSVEAWNILFIHTDGGGDPAAARAQKVVPAARRIEAELEVSAPGTVAVVPVRETEAWALADGKALREVFGSRLDDEALGVPSTAARVETFRDPKHQLRSAYRTAAGGRRRRRLASVATLLEAIGERVSLDVLRRIPALETLEADLSEALRQLRYISE